MEDAGCDRPAGGPVGEPEVGAEADESPQAPKGAPAMIRVGQKAPDFTAPAYYKGKFTTSQLSEHLGKWIVLCFYPGDFTFV